MQKMPETPLKEHGDSFDQASVVVSRFAGIIEDICSPAASKSVVSAK